MNEAAYEARKFAIEWYRDLWLRSYPQADRPWIVAMCQHVIQCLTDDLYGDPRDPAPTDEAQYFERKMDELFASEDLMPTRLGWRSAKDYFNGAVGTEPSCR